MEPWNKLFNRSKIELIQENIGWESVDWESSAACRNLSVDCGILKVREVKIPTTLRPLFLEENVPSFSLLQSCDENICAVGCNVTPADIFW